jgi:hypothetical protein
MHLLMRFGFSAGAAVVAWGFAAVAAFFPPIIAKAPAKGVIKMDLLSTVWSLLF